MIATQMAKKMQTKYTIEFKNVENSIYNNNDDNNN